MLDKKFWTEVGPNVRDKYRKHIFRKARDVYSRAFKGYTSSYKEFKQKGNNKRQMSEFANSHAPVFTGDLLRDFGTVYKETNNGFTMGWSTYGARIEQLAKRGRFLSTDDQPLPTGIINYMMGRAKPFTDKKLKRLLPKSKTYKIGKK